MPPPTPNEIRLQLKTLLTPVIATEATKKAKIIEYLAWAFKEGSGEDPANLRSELDQVPLAEGGGVIDRINCLMLSEGSFTQTLPPPPSDLRETRPRGRSTITRRVRFAYFYQFGDESELAFSDNVELIRTTVNDNPKLGFAALDNYNAGPAQFIKGHRGLQDVAEPLLESFGGTLAHVRLMTLDIDVIEPLERG
jgi:hypothetical protein